MDESSSQLEPTEDLSSDVVQEETDPSTIIVIHPGSKYLRIGLASDSMPKRMLHAIARKRKSSLPCHCRTDPFLVPKVMRILEFFICLEAIKCFFYVYNQGKTK